jgi:autotransporter-associated beta strand protein
VNLTGGTLQCTKVTTVRANASTNSVSGTTATFNFNGGTLRAAASSTTFFQGGTVATLPTSTAVPITTIVQAGGAIIDDGGFAITVLEPLQHDGNLGGTPDGGLIKLGTGTLSIASASTYTGNTVISNGTLLVSNSIVSPVRVAKGTLSGFGTIGLGVTNNGTVMPGSATAVGTLTCSSDLLNNAGSTNLFKLNRSASPSNDVMNVNGNLTYAGTLAVQNLGGTYALGDTFKLYNVAGTTGGTFSATNLPSVGPGLGLSWNQATATLTVIQTVNPNPTNITAVVSGSTLTLSWPVDHTGWYLQAQTNSLSTGLGTNWVDVAGSSSVNSVMIPVDPSKGAVFYRLSLNP